MKPYIWWTDNPWAALLALAAIIIVFSIAGIVVIFFTYSRYMKFLNPIQAQTGTLENLHFRGPQTLMREYETQSLNMYVPPDDTLVDLNEFQAGFGEAGIERISYKGQGSKVSAVISSVYQGIFTDSTMKKLINLFIKYWLMDQVHWPDITLSRVGYERVCMTSTKSV